MAGRVMAGGAQSLPVLAGKLRAPPRGVTAFNAFRSLVVIVQGATSGAEQVG